MSERGKLISAFAAYQMKRKASKSSPKRLEKKHKKVEGKHLVKAVNKQKNIQSLSKGKNKLKSNGISVNDKSSVPLVKENVNIQKPNGPKKSTLKINGYKNIQRKKLSLANDSLSSDADIAFENSFSKAENKLKINRIEGRKKIKKNKKEKQSNKKAKIENYLEDPMVKSKALFTWLIFPTKLEEFFQTHWEKTPLHLRRTGTPNYFKHLISTPLLDKILREHYILYTKNIDITSYSNGTRETHNPPGRAVPSVVWDYYLNGCSVRMLNPQTFIPKLHALNAMLQELFGCFVGANCYLTPPNSQGFAPHYDDIEAFILQVEGKKRWRLYKPQKANDYLPRYSSKDFDQSEIGEPFLDTVVEAGDMLYLPRGTIHQGETVDDAHSLHITLSVYQKNSWGDFLEKLLPDALQEAITNNSKFREGLPLDYLQYTGFIHSTDKTNIREAFKEKVKHLLDHIVDYIDIDKAADAMAKNHVHDFLPPVFADNEKECSVAQDGERMTKEGVVENRVEIEPDTKIRLLRFHCMRLVEESGEYRIYYSNENSKEYHEYEAQFLEVGEEFVPAVKEIILRYPEFIRVEDLPIDGEDNKIQITKDLWERGIVITEEPLVILE